MCFWIIITGRNCERYYHQCLASVVGQQVPDGCRVRLVVVDDASTDLTRPILFRQFYRRGFSSFLWDQEGDCDALFLWHDKREYAAKSRYDAMRCALRDGARPDDVFVLLDLDDYLPHDRVIERLDREYEAGAEVTFGSWRFDGDHAPWHHEPYSLDTLHRNTYRQEPFRCAPLRTFRVGLGLAVMPEELQDDDGAWLRSCTDVALSWGVLDRADPERVRWIDEVMYVYRGHHAHVTRKTDPAKTETMAMLRKRQPVEVTV